MTDMRDIKGQLVVVHGMDARYLGVYDGTIDGFEAAIKANAVIRLYAVLEIFTAIAQPQSRIVGAGKAGLEVSNTFGMVDGAVGPLHHMDIHAFEGFCVHSQDPATNDLFVGVHKRMMKIGLAAVQKASSTVQ